MIDGVDGLAGGFTVLVVGVLLATAADVPTLSSDLLYITAGSVAGFLLFNLRTPWRRQASVFLGDAGSLVLGYVLAWFAIRDTQGQVPALQPITVVWLFGLPLADTAYLMGSRLLRGANPLSADRFHFHHLLLGAGLSPGWTLYVWLLIAGLFMATGIVCAYAGVSQVLMLAGFILAFACYCVSVTIGWWGVTNSRSLREDSLQNH
jgi:UDP-GlcNAc:undecaprenyl-phosphate GlcNAc-1-phosphate transferase